MPTIIGGDDVFALLHQPDVRIVDVRAPEDHEAEHILGALNLPLDSLTGERAEAVLGRGGAVVVYCDGGLSDLSARAASMLESLGYMPVYDYRGGKRDWTAHGYPTSGSRSVSPRAGTAAHLVPTCSPNDEMHEVLHRADVERAGICVVVAPGDVVLGCVHPGMHDGVVASAVMHRAPPSMRYDEDLAEVVRSMRAASRDEVLVTTPGGRLVGRLRLRDAEQLLRGRG